MGGKLRDAPVYFTLAQVRFNPILTLESYINGLQETLRKQGFPDFRRNLLTAFSIASPEGSSPQLSPPQSEAQYLFNDTGGTSGFVLGQGFVSYQTTEYDVFEKFSRKLLDGIESIHRAVELAYIERIGFRTLDAVFPRGNDALEQYVQPEVMGLSGKLPGSLVYSFSETRIQAELGFVVARVVIQDGPVAFPPDLMPLVLRVADRFAKQQGRHAILDADAFFEAREPFDLGKIEQRLLQLHDQAGITFRSTVTPHALGVWE
jgi:uncharacterized protein (TIGR04255 family)